MTSKTDSKKEVPNEHFLAHSVTFMNWINATLGKRTSAGETIFEKLSDGVLLIKLLHHFAHGKKMTGRWDWC